MIFLALFLFSLFGGFLTPWDKDTIDPLNIGMGPSPEHFFGTTQAGIDLLALIVDGTAIPERELRKVPEQNQVFFTPGDGKAIESLRAGQVCVTAIVWSSSIGRGRDDKSFNWCFGVT